MRRSPLKSLPLLLHISLAHAVPYLTATVGAGTEKEKGEAPGSPEFWWKLIISVVLVLTGGVFAGYVLI